MATQEELRRRVLAARNRLSAREIEAKSAAIIGRLVQLQAFRDCRTVMFYASFRSEVQTGQAMSFCLQEGKKAGCFPCGQGGDHITGDSRRGHGSCRVYPQPSFFREPYFAPGVGVGLPDYQVIAVGVAPQPREE